MALLEHRRFVWVLVIAWAAAYLPHLGTRDLRLEEGRRATVAREMLASGDFVRPTLYGDTYLHKPPGFPWLIAAFGWLLGEVNPWAARLPSALAALGCALVALRFAPDVLDRRTRNLAALLMLGMATLLDKGTLGEIDATLCLVVAGALKCWWDGHRPDGQTSRSWLLVGLLLGAAGLLKGPAGPALFYLTVGPHLAWQRDLGRLFTRGHLGCVVLAVLPAAAWVIELLDRDVVSLSHLLALWAHQVGAGGAVGAPVDPEARSQVINHYMTFLPQLAGMFFPAVLWLPFVVRRPSADSDRLRPFLLCAVLGPVVAFYLYSEARPRHLMPVAFPAAVLAAAVIARRERGGRWSVVLAGMLLAGWAVFNAVVVPARAPLAPTRVALRSIEGKLPPGELVYTTRTYPVTAEGYYNLQFHLARDVRAADVDRLMEVAPCLAVVTPAEAELLRGEGWVVEEIGRLTARPESPYFTFFFFSGGLAATTSLSFLNSSADSDPSLFPSSFLNHSSRLAATPFGSFPSFFGSFSPWNAANSSFESFWSLLVSSLVNTAVVSPPFFASFFFFLASSWAPAGAASARATANTATADHTRVIGSSPDG